MYDSNNKEYIDLAAGIAVNALGHCPPNVTKVLADQANTLVHCSNLYYNKFAPILSKLLVDNTKRSGGMPDAHSVFLSNSGTEANEAALKFARKYGKTVGNDNKTKLISFNGSFHGRTFGALTMTPNPKYQAPFAPMVPNVAYGDFNDIKGLDALITKDTAGVILEPIQGEGGINPATELFVKAVRKRCNEVDAVLIFDEIQCGLGRTGKFWAHSHYGPDAQPDIITCAKALGNGFPIGGTIVNEKVHNAIKPGDHGTTYGGNPLASRVAIEVVSELSRATFLHGVESRGRALTKSLNHIVQNFPKLATEVRGSGLIQGLQLTINPSHVIERAQKKGFLIISCGKDTIRFIPPLNIPMPALKQALTSLREIFEEINDEIEGIVKPSKKTKST